MAFDPSVGAFVEVPGMQLECTTIGELLEQLERETGAYVVPHDPPKYFRCHAAREDPDFLLVDIHVRRGDEEICIQQDLAFALLPSDKVILGPLAC